MDSATSEILSTSLGDSGCGFSVGGFGALAEFQDAALLEHSSGGPTWFARSARGALAIEAQWPATALAYEGLAAAADGWQHGICLFGELDANRLPGRDRLTELGRDEAAVRDIDRDGLLFDLGAGLPHVEFCVRTNDRTLVRLLRAHLGQAVIAVGHPVMEAVIDASPHRVVRSRLARIEVYQRIDRHQTPVGPHTHLLPDLLQRRRTHSANLPLPRSRVPLLTLHPEHPLHDEQGRQRPFVRTAYDRFEHVLQRCGDRRYTAEKLRLRAAIERGDTPQSYAPARTRLGRLAQRVTLRQLAHTHPDPASYAPWRARFRA